MLSSKHADSKDSLDSSSPLSLSVIAFVNSSRRNPVSRADE